MAGERFNRPGLTLIEVLFALTVIAFALLGVAGMFPSALRSVLGGGQTTKATALAREMVEMIRNEPFDILYSRYMPNGQPFKTTDLNPVVNCQQFPPNPQTYDADYNKKKWKCDFQTTAAAVSGQVLPEGQGLPGGYGTVTVACVNPNGTTGSCGSTNLRRVTVTVAWQSQGPRSLSLVTYVARFY